MSNYITETHLIDYFHEGERPIFIQSLLQHGWGKVELSNHSYQLIQNWETIFAKAFDLSTEELQQQGFYRSVQGVTVGYRGEKELPATNESKMEMNSNSSSVTNNEPSTQKFSVASSSTVQIQREREFIECRLQSNGLPNPNYPVTGYALLVRNIFLVVSRIGYVILQLIARELGLDDRTFTDLTDLSFHKLNELLPSQEKEETGVKNEESIQLSSTLLRICKYQGALQIDDLFKGSSSSPDKFGSHTDTSFITLGLTSSTPALDIFDLVHKQWISVEENESRTVLNVFIGEFLQIFTNHFLQASVHRVNDFPVSLTRISCPVIVRGNNRKIVDFFNSKKYHHPAYSLVKEDDTINEVKRMETHHILNYKILNREKPLELLPSIYTGMKMKLVHLLLDKKRKKCFEKNTSSEANGDAERWVLSSFPIEYIPAEYL